MIVDQTPTAATKQAPSGKSSPTNSVVDTEPLPSMSMDDASSWGDTAPSASMSAPVREGTKWKATTALTARERAPPRK